MEKQGFKVTTNDASETIIINNDPPETEGTKQAATENEAANKKGGK